MNGIYLFLTLKEIIPMLISKFISRISAKERLIQFEFEDGALFISLYPQALGLYSGEIRKDFERLPYFDDHVAGSRIVRIEQLDYRPVVDLATEKVEYGQKDNFLIRLLFYKEAPNLTVKCKETQRSLFHRYIEKKLKQSIFDATPEQLKDEETFVKNFEGVDRYLAKELNEENLERLKAILQGKSCQPKITSILPMRISLFAQTFISEHNTWNELFTEGINSYLEQRNKISQQSDRQGMIKKLERKVGQLARELENKEAMEFNKTAGELLITNISRIKRGMNKIILFNPYTQQDMEIELDPAKDGRENAEIYFKKYKKLKRGIPRKQEQLMKLKKQLELLKSGAVIQEKKPRSYISFQKEEKLSLPFREFVLPTGSKVYVGKNAKSNMELTFRFARPDDYFFHIRGYEGAHTILRPLMQKGQNIKKEDIEWAAAIAAYFSKAKTQKNVAVSYTQRKYLKKSKKGKLGTVILMRESVVFVDPGLPADTQN
ncbi:MAG: NFACT RNA binding domain-containing protein [bacterium]